MLHLWVKSCGITYPWFQRSLNWFHLSFILLIKSRSLYSLTNLAATVEGRREAADPVLDFRQPPPRPRGVCHVPAVVVDLEGVALVRHGQAVAREDHEENAREAPELFERKSLRLIAGYLPGN